MTEDTEKPRRPCGDCTACCEGWLRSDVMGLQPGKSCQHCTGSGCAIYADRPQDPCRDFHCAWSDPENDLPEDMRPDRCGAIVRVNFSWNQWQKVVALPVGPTIPEKTLKRLIEYAKERNLPIFYFEQEFTDGKWVRSRRFATGPSQFMAEAGASLKPEDVWTSEPGLQMSG